MENILNNGQCPECELKGTNSIIELNMGDNWECPICNLQFNTIGETHLGILDERGNGRFRDNYYKAKKYIKNRILMRKPLFKDDDCIIKNINELQEYISTITKSESNEALVFAHPGIEQYDYTKKKKDI